MSDDNALSIGTQVDGDLDIISPKLSLPAETIFIRHALSPWRVRGTRRERPPRAPSATPDLA